MRVSNAAAVVGTFCKHEHADMARAASARIQRTCLTSLTQWRIRPLPVRAMFDNAPLTVRPCPVEVHAVHEPESEHNTKRTSDVPTSTPTRAPAELFHSSRPTGTRTEY